MPRRRADRVASSSRTNARAQIQIRHVLPDARVPRDGRVGHWSALHARTIVVREHGEAALAAIEDWHRVPILGVDCEWRLGAVDSSIKVTC